MALGLLLCVVVLLAASAAQAAFEPENAGWQGCSQFVAVARRQLGASRVIATDRLDYDALSGSDAVVILAPESTPRFAPLSAFLARGGRVAIADDLPRADAVLERFRMRRVAPPTQPAERLRDNPDLPIALPAAPGGVRHPMLEGVGEVHTNHPAALQAQAGVEVTPLLVIPQAAERPALLAATGVIGKPDRCGLVGRETSSEACGRLVAVADPSIFINLMMDHPGNQRFAAQLVGYLLDDDAWGRRGGRLYFVSGRFAQAGAGDPSSGAWEDFAEQLREQLGVALRDQLSEALSVAIAVALLVTLCLWAGAQVTRSPATARGQFEQVTPLAAQGGFAGRVAVLSAPTTDRSLLLLEVKRSVELALAQALGVSGPCQLPALLRLCEERRLVPPAERARLQQLESSLQAAEQAVLSARSMAVPDSQLQQMVRQLEDLQGRLAPVLQHRLAPQLKAEPAAELGGSRKT